MKQVLFIFVFAQFCASFGQKVDDSQLLWSNPYLVQSDTSYTLDTIQDRIEGQVIDYTNNPFPLVYVTLEDKNGAKTIHYCDSEGKFFLPKQLLNLSLAYVKIGCCTSDTLKIDSNTKTLKIKYQGGFDCLEGSSNQNCNLIAKDKYYVNYMVTDVPFYEIQLGSEILNSDYVELSFYEFIDPNGIYRNDENEKFLGEALIKLKQLPFSEWDDNLFNRE